MKKNGYSTYQRVNVATADPAKIIVLLYEGTIRNMNQAIDHFEGGRKDDASQRIKKTLDILHYLRSVLDFEKGGEIATHLSQLYDFVRNELAEANIHADVEKIRTSILVIQPLLEGWQGISQQAGTANIQEIDPPKEPINLSAVG